MSFKYVKECVLYIQLNILKRDAFLVVALLRKLFTIVYHFCSDPVCTDLLRVFMVLSILDTISLYTRNKSYTLDIVTKKLYS